jgi:hypothetical protein
MRARSKGQRSWPGPAIACSSAAVSVRGSVMASLAGTTQAQPRGEPVQTAVAGDGDVGRRLGTAAGVDGGLDQVEEHPQGVRNIAGEGAPGG